MRVSPIPVNDGGLQIAKLLSKPREGKDGEREREPGSKEWRWDALTGRGEQEKGKKALVVPIEHSANTLKHVQRISLSTHRM